MANEFIARKGLRSLDNVQITGSLDVNGTVILNRLEVGREQTNVYGGGAQHAMHIFPNDDSRSIISFGDGLGPGNDPGYIMHVNPYNEAVDTARMVFSVSDNTTGAGHDQFVFAGGTSVTAPNPWVRIGGSSMWNTSNMSSSLAIHPNGQEPAYPGLLINYGGLRVIAPNTGSGIKGYGLDATAWRKPSIVSIENRNIIDSTHGQIGGLNYIQKHRVLDIKANGDLYYVPRGYGYGSYQHSTMFVSASGELMRFGNGTYPLIAVTGSSYNGFLQVGATNGSIIGPATLTMSTRQKKGFISFGGGQYSAGMLIAAQGEDTTSIKPINISAKGGVRFGTSTAYNQNNAVFLDVHRKRLGIGSYPVPQLDSDGVTVIGSLPGRSQLSGSRLRANLHIKSYNTRFIELESDLESNQATSQSLLIIDKNANIETSGSIRTHDSLFVSLSLNDANGLGTVVYDPSTDKLFFTGSYGGGGGGEGGDSIAAGTNINTSDNGLGVVTVNLDDDVTGLTSLTSSNLLVEDSAIFEGTFLFNGFDFQVQNASVFSGSTIFGSGSLPSAASHQFTGSVLITGSVVVESGSVGIGTTNPASRFNVVNGNTDIRLDAGASDLTPVVSVINTTEAHKAAALGAGTNGSFFAFDESGTFSIVAGPKSKFLDNTVADGSFTNLLKVDGTTGNVGIGTTSPGEKLEVDGEVRLSSGHRLQFTNDNVGLYRDSNDLRLAGYTGIHFLSSTTTMTSQVERMRITNAGDVGIGTTSPTEKLSVVGNISASGDMSASGRIMAVEGFRIPSASIDGVNNKYDFYFERGNLNGATSFKLRHSNSGNHIVFQASNITDMLQRVDIHRGMNVYDLSDNLLLQVEEDNNTVNIGSNTNHPTSSINVYGTTTVEGSGSTVFQVLGSQGQLFSITDQLSGSLFGVSDVSGLPMFEVFSDGNTVLGKYADGNVSSSLKSTASFGVYYGDGSKLTGIDANSGVEAVGFDFTGNTIPFIVQHNLDSEDISVTCYTGSVDTNNKRQIIPREVRIINNESIQLEFDRPTTGRLVLHRGGNIVSGSAFSYRQVLGSDQLLGSPHPDYSYEITHNLGELYPIVQFYTASFDGFPTQMIPRAVTSIDINTIRLEFDTPMDGTIVVKR